MNSKKTTILMIALALFVLPIALSFAPGASDAGVSIEGDAYQGTVTPDGGYVHLVLKSTEPNPVTLSVDAYITDSGKLIGTAQCALSANGTATADIFVKAGGVGDHNVTLKCSPEGFFVLKETSLLVHVTQSVWSNWTSWATIIIIAILIIIAVAYKMHSAPKAKADVTFTELEKQRKDAKGISEPSVTTERRKYGSHKSEEKAPAPKKAPAKEATKEPPKEADSKKVFTEMEEQRKRAAPAKEAPKKADEPEKLKYVSSRRK